MMTIKSNADEVAKKLDKTRDKLIDGIKRGVVDIQSAIMIRSTSAYLQGPRPIHLGIDTGRLIRSMFGRFTYEGGGTYGGTNYSIMNLRVQNKMVIAEYGTKAISDSGEDYPARWEYGSDPRPFMRPAIMDTQNKFKSLMEKQVKSAIDKALNARN